MPPRVIVRRRPSSGDTLANALYLGTQGFLQGSQLRSQREKLTREKERQTLADEYTRARINELQRRERSYNEPLPPGYVRLPGGRIVRAVQPTQSRVSPQLAAEVTSGLTPQGKSLDQSYRMALAGELGYEPYETTPAVPPKKLFGFTYGGKPSEYGFRKPSLPREANLEIPESIPGGVRMLPKDQFGFFKGQKIKHQNGRTYTYLGNNQWEES